MRTRVSEAEFQTLPESLDRIELLDGEVVLSPSPSGPHQRVVTELAIELGLWSRSHPPAAVRVALLDVRFAPERILQPDLVVFVDGLEPDAAVPLTTTPDLCVEVLSARRSYDRITKRHVYAEAGVPEYWVVDLEERCVEVYRGSELVRTERGVLTSSLLLGLSIDVERLL